MRQARIASYLSPLLATALATAQKPPSPGLRLFGSMMGTDVFLIDDGGHLPHTWSSNYLPGHGIYLLPDGSLLRSINTSNKGNGSGGAVQRIGWDSTVLWEFHYDGPGVLSHHDIAPLPNGNVVLIAWEDLDTAHAVAVGRDPALITAGLFQPDHLVEVQPTGPTTGAIVWEWHITDHTIQDRNPAQPRFGVVQDHPELIDVNFPADPSSVDWTHMNGIDYDAAHDWLVVSVHNQSEVWIIDHGTTTGEARGHSGGRWGKGGDLLYRWGNPAAYRAGATADQQLFGQHDPRFVRDGRPGAGHLTVFNNNFAPGRSAVFELELPVDAAGRFQQRDDGSYGPGGPSWQYTAPGFFSPIISGAERLPNGNTLICSGYQSHLFEVTPAGRTVWQYQHTGWVFQAQYVESSLWAPDTTISASTGGQMTFEIAAGSQHAGELFMLLGSASGTSHGLSLQGVQMPLDFDLLTLLLLANSLSGTLGDTAGQLSALGTASASLQLVPAPWSPILLGQGLDFATAFADPATLNVLRSSNATHVPIVP